MKIDTTPLENCWAIWAEAEQTHPVAFPVPTEWEVVFASLILQDNLEQHCSFSGGFVFLCF